MTTKDPAALAGAAAACQDLLCLQEQLAEARQTIALMMRRAMQRQEEGTQPLGLSYRLRGYAEPAGELPDWVRGVLQEAADLLDERQEVIEDCMAAVGVEHKAELVSAVRALARHKRPDLDLNTVRPERALVGGGRATTWPNVPASLRPVDEAEARSRTLFIATSADLLYGSGLKATLEAHVKDGPGFGQALDALTRRAYQEAGDVLLSALDGWQPRTTADQQDLGVLRLAAWLLVRPQAQGGAS